MNKVVLVPSKLPGYLGEGEGWKDSLLFIFISIVPCIVAGWCWRLELLVKGVGNARSRASACMEKRA